MKPFRERLVFDPERGEYRDGAARYLMIRADMLMGILAELPEEQRPDVLAAFARATAKFGGKSAQSYRAAGASDPAVLLATIEQTAPQLGWGRWKLECDGDALSLLVTNSPFVAGHGPSKRPVCAPIAGMLSAVATLVLGAPAAATEEACAAVTGETQCRFRAAPAPAR